MRRLAALLALLAACDPSDPECVRQPLEVRAFTGEDVAEEAMVCTDDSPWCEFRTPSFSHDSEHELGCSADEAVNLSDPYWLGLSPSGHYSLTFPSYGTTEGSFIAQTPPSGKPDAKLACAR